MKYDAVLEGGGCKISGLVGALAGIETQGFEPSHLAGTSAGAIVASLRAAGYTPDELRVILLETNFKEFLDGSILNALPYKLLTQKGLYKGDYFYNWVKEKLFAKGVSTFRDLRFHDDNPKYRYRLKVIAADISSGKMIVLPDDVPMYNLDPDNFEVAFAIRMSMSIPYYFKPVILDGHYIVDGGLLSNFPIWLFDDTILPTWPTFGIILDEGDIAQDNKITGPISYVTAMITTMLSARDRKFIRPEDFKHRTILVPSGNIGTTQFNITTIEKETLYHSGLKAALEFFVGWDFNTYVTWAKESRGL